MTIQTADFTGKHGVLEAKGRHDPCGTFIGFRLLIRTDVARHTDSLRRSRS